MSFKQRSGKEVPEEGKDEQKLTYLRLACRSESWDMDRF